MFCREKEGVSARSSQQTTIVVFVAWNNHPLLKQWPCSVPTYPIPRRIFCGSKDSRTQNTSMMRWLWQDPAWRLHIMCILGGLPHSCWGWAKSYGLTRVLATQRLQHIRFITKRQLSADWRTLNSALRGAGVSQRVSEGLDVQIWNKCVRMGSLFFSKLFETTHLSRNSTFRTKGRLATIDGYWWLLQYTMWCPLYWCLLL